MKARLVLEDGTCFEGESFGAQGESIGEAVFNTSMTGYQEILTDPSYYGQIVTMTYPLIGNYGISAEDNESSRPFVYGFVVREYAEFASNWRNEISLGDWLKKHGIIGIAGIDTRMLTRKIRLHGTMKAILTTKDESVDELLAKLKAAHLLQDQVSQVSLPEQLASEVTPHKRVVLVDFGAKTNIQRELAQRGCEVHVVSYQTTVEEILAYQPDGVVLSNGPGDPKNVPSGMEIVRGLLGKVPIFGICLGHQLFALACGADTKRLKFGHRGGNHPVKELVTDRTYITAQNHGYAVDPDSIEGTELEITHIALNDGTVEGLRHLKKPAFSVQYHPEAAPGPHDSGYLFDQFIEMMEMFAKEGESVHA
ncbi:carbamoyl-phosphate synthase small subunit [Seinonella peptonophila]|uniref:Carbamoyl phosphate synthase small chain n=1 Tax=Seinonella peptonophila TaxID=112248 RepID=A0A1M4UXW2_9BACL|nr:glutamine-hydrolyzing carbamoyl-phosphate synthase small subunit [Seinonella peptonophila]SHE61512.1 carbamoyl-phosphate synthase small subunit [Seinonella peptonophila]